MKYIKYLMLFFILIACSLIGKYLSKKYVERLKELEEMKNALNIFESKIKYTYDPIPEIFDEISKNNNKNTSKIFKLAKEKMKEKTANIAWEEALEEAQTNLKKEDKYVLKSLSK